MLDIFYERRFMCMDLSENPIETLESLFKKYYDWKVPEVQKYTGKWGWDYKCIFYNGAINLFLSVDVYQRVKDYCVTTDYKDTFPLKVLRDFERNRKKD